MQNKYNRYREEVIVVQGLTIIVAQELSISHFGNITYGHAKKWIKEIK